MEQSNFGGQQNLNGSDAPIRAHLQEIAALGGRREPAFAESGALPDPSWTTADRQVIPDPPSGVVGMVEDEKFDELGNDAALDLVDGLGNIHEPDHIHDEDAVYATAYDHRLDEHSILSDIAFSDLYIEIYGIAWYKRSPGDAKGFRLSGDYLDEVADLLAFIRSMPRNKDFRLKWRGMDLRGACLETLAGTVYTLRRLLPGAMPFEAIGYPARLRQALLAPEFRKGGIVLFSGPTGAGKTTAMTSYVVENMRTFGGTCWTIENPIEIIIQGRYENGDTVGTVYQTEVSDDSEFGDQIKPILRAAPNLIMFGELRTSEAAAKAVIAGTSGHLVLASIHGNDIPSVLERVKNLVKEAKYDIAMFADTLCAVVHQTMTLENTKDGVKRRIVPTPLIVTGSERQSGIRGQLRTGNLTQLTSVLEHQERMIHVPKTFGDL